VSNEQKIGTLRRVRRRVYAAIPQPIRMGPRYWQIKRTYGEADRWPLERIQAEQLRMLRGIISHAYATVPGYQKLCREAGASPKDLRTDRKSVV
jgi:phenylacetate-coenzyme A ligase PaaK-like adenylate-forming protein